MKNESKFEKFLRLNGVTNRRFSEITGLKGQSVRKYIDNPTLLRLNHLRLLSESQEGKYHNLNEIELLKTIKKC